MKKIPAPLKSAPKKTDVEKAIGGQPENDADARAAGLPSATSASADENTKRANTRSKKQADEVESGYQPNLTRVSANVRSEPA